MKKERTASLLPVAGASVLLALSTLPATTVDAVPIDGSAEDFEVQWFLGGSGHLIGATNVNVDGILYDVAFIGGPCELFAFPPFCNPDDFAFDNEAAARSAGRALLDQVFIDTGDGAPADFDTFSGLGCANGLDAGCEFLIPYGFSGTGNSGHIEYVSVINGPFDEIDGILALQLLLGIDSVPPLERYRWARFLPLGPAPPVVGVPEPASAVLLAAGLLALGVVRRRSCLRMRSDER